MEARRCPEGHVSYPPHRRCPDCGARGGEPVDLAEGTATVLTWTESTATPPGVRSPNALAIVEFDLEGDAVRAIGGLVEGASVETGDRVRPVRVAELRDPGAGIRAAESQDWSGYRFEPV